MAASILTKMAGRTASGKSKAGKLEVHDPALDTVIDEVVAQKRASETADSLLRQAEDQLGAAIHPERLRLCRQSGRVEASVRVNNRVTFTQQCRYSKVDEEHRAAVEAAFGQRFASFFRLTWSVALTAEAAGNEQLVNELVKLIGEERFMSCFVVRGDLEVTEAFHSAFTLEPEIEKAARPLMDQGVIKPFKASTRE